MANRTKLLAQGTKQEVGGLIQAIKRNLSGVQVSVEGNPYLGDLKLFVTGPARCVEGLTAEALCELS